MTNLYSFIPPIIVILSLIALIVFLVKKSEKVAKIKVESAADAEDAILGKKEGLFKRIMLKIKSLFLSILENLIRLFRFLSFNMSAKFQNWSNSIRRKRMENKKALGEKPETDIIEKLKAYDMERKGGVSIKVNSGEKDQTLPEKEVKPMISEKVVSPQPKFEMKDRLETLLIERIAGNPKDVEAYERLGEYYLEIKSYDFAKECFKQVIKLDPLNRNAKYRMRRLEYLLSK